MATRKLIGNLIDKRGKPQAGGEVWLSAPGVAADQVVTREDGSFEFTLDDDWPAGSYRLEAPPNVQALGASRRVEIAESGPPAPQVLTVAPRYEVRERDGLIFLAVLIVALLGLGQLYLWLHDFSFTELRRGGSPPVAALAQDRSEPAAAPAGDAPAGPASPEAVGALDPAAEPGGETGAEADAQTAAAAPDTPFFWDERPEILLETLFWALAATLIRLIFRTGHYLYQRCFLATAIPHHVALIFSVPILAVLISFVLSLVEVSIELSDVALQLDMGNVYIAILVAALIGFAPWKAWDFLQSLADLLFARLGGLFRREETPAA